MIYGCPTPVGNEHMDAILLAPPLIITDAEIDELITKLDGLWRRSSTSSEAGPSNDELRAALHRAADWAADFVEHVDELPVDPRVEPGRRDRVAARTPAGRGRAAGSHDRRRRPGDRARAHPLEPSRLSRLLRQHRLGPGILGEMMAATLNVNAMLWQTSPAATELEQVVLRVDAPS